MHPNRAIHRDGISVLALVTREGEEIPCCIDSADYPLVSGFHWHAHRDKKSIYAYTNVYAPGTRCSVRMHRLLIPNVPLIEHQNGIGTDNRRSNIRAANLGQNAANHTKRQGANCQYLGVCWDRSRSKFQAEIRKDGRYYFLGRFDDERIAAVTYGLAALSLHGEFARLNILTHEYAATPDRNAVEAAA